MNKYFADLHIHIGRTKSGKPVKITGAKSLTLSNILYEASFIKGMDMIGVIDCHVPEVLQELVDLIDKGSVELLKGGGLRYANVTLILGSEIEVYDDHCKGPMHVLAFFPTIDLMETFSKWLAERVKNINLSTQRMYDTGKNLQRKVKELGGLFIPAHVFTPFKSLYGSSAHVSLTEILNPDWIDAIELGLSSDTEMADQLMELHSYTFLSNSDAHSLGKIAREYQAILMEEPTFEELAMALHEKNGRKILANYGLDPRLGKYHRTSCEKCFTLLDDAENCPACGHKRATKGVFERLQELKNAQGKFVENRKIRPPYIHQVPLEFIPKLGPKTMDKLRAHFGTEMNIIHHVSEQELKKIVSPTIAHMIIQARKGELALASGGGGHYGKVIE
ncbi:endonuclease Q family protein [Calidifontibacillus erzurumensis]|uniref:TIGR00375 family protein n=1 Tax=Calidifontibacillus erzurumensis TaxID=2741433 RepID=A0A8J8KAA4_9BACI|nr:endonuclease Q family protein [Calidifontibacillus erzurumensis]NSL50437.1 TIGR00375 family protein [Calidifontibacillus erzurumensis]